MALTRKMLKGMGLTDEQIDTIIEGHDETVSGLKDQIGDLTAKAQAADALKKERDALQKQIDDAKAGTDWKAEYDKLKADTEAKETAAKVRAAYKDLLKDEKVDEAEINMILRASGERLKGMKLDKDGKLVNEDKLREEIKSDPDISRHIVTTKVRGAEVKTPPAGGRVARTREEIYAVDEKGRYKLSTEERQQAIRENPEAFGR